MNNKIITIVSHTYNEEENITLETMAQVAASMGKKLRIAFE